MIGDDWLEMVYDILPKDWRKTKLSEIANISSGGSAPQGEKYFGGKWPFIRVSHLEVDNLAVDKWDLITDEAIKKYRLKIFPKGTIVFPKSGASIRLEKRAEIPNEAYIVNHLCTVLAKATKVDQEFLLYALRYHKFAKDKTDGYPTLTLKEIGNTYIALPPLPEQRAIAQVLSTVRQAIEATERVIAAARELKRSMMKYLFTYGPVPVDLADQVKLKETEIGEVPEKWVEKILSELITFTKKPRKRNVSTFDKIPFIPMDAISTDKLYPDYYIEKTPKDISSGIYTEVGNLILAKITPSFENGKQAIVSDLPNGFAYATTEVFSISPKDSEDMETIFLFHYLKRSEIRSHMAGKMEGTTGRQRVPIDVVKNLPLALPCKTDQKQIIYFIDALYKKIAAEENHKSALEALFNSLLYNLMTGKVRVQVDLPSTKPID